jgi:hypothetical protein
MSLWIGIWGSIGENNFIIRFLLKFYYENPLALFQKLGNLGQLREEKALKTA